MFDGNKLLITGGTGSFGNAVIRRFLNSKISEIRILSRDEKKQEDMRHKYADSRLKFYIGDVRDYNSIINAIRGVDFIFHSAALKQVPSCEFHPIEAAKTNIFGTENVLNAAIDAKVKRVICLGTDKAVYPVNAMGMSKALMEKVLVAKSREGGDTTIICGTRYGNVMASRGSVIPLFVEQIRNETELTITDPNMTRFMMTLEQAVSLVEYAFINGRPGDIFIQKAPATTVKILAQAISELLGKHEHPMRIIGTRHGEKRYETLLSREEIVSAEDLGTYFRIPPDLRDLNYSRFIEEGEEKITEAQEYNSENTERLDLAQMKELLLKLNYIKSAIDGNYIDPES